MSTSLCAISVACIGPIRGRGITRCERHCDSLTAEPAIQPLTFQSLALRVVLTQSRLGPVTRLFDLPAPEQSLRVQGGGRQCGSEIDGRGTRHRPYAEVAAWQLWCRPNIQEARSTALSARSGLAQAIWPPERRGRYRARTWAGLGGEQRSTLASPHEARIKTAVIEVKPHLRRL